MEKFKDSETFGCFVLVILIIVIIVAFCLYPFEALVVLLALILVGAVCFLIHVLRKKRVVTIEKKVRQVLAQNPDKILDRYELDKFYIISFLTKRGAKILDLNSAQNHFAGYFSLKIDFELDGVSGSVDTDWIREKVIEFNFKSCVIDQMYYGHGVSLYDWLEEAFKKIEKVDS